MHIQFPQPCFIVWFKPLELVVQHSSEVFLDTFDDVNIFTIVWIPCRTTVIQSTSDVRIIELQDTLGIFELLCCSEYKADHLITFSCNRAEMSVEFDFIIKFNT